MRTQRLDWRARAAIAFENHQRSLACIVSFAILMALHRSYDIRGMQFDAAAYWELATPGRLGTVPSMRGYLFPALLLPLHYLCDLAANRDLVFRLGMSCAYAVLLSVFVPAAFQQAFGDNRNAPGLIYVGGYESSCRLQVGKQRSAFADFLEIVHNQRDSGLARNRQ